MALIFKEPSSLAVCKKALPPVKVASLLKLPFTPIEPKEVCFFQPVFPAVKVASSGIIKVLSTLRGAELVTLGGVMTVEVWLTLTGARFLAVGGER